jgi:hypothetical protein
MYRLALNLTLAVIFITSAAYASDAPAQGEVAITASADREQPSGWPVVVELTLTNVGNEPISWWCGGPDVYPGAEHFRVQVRQGVKDDWRDVKPTNGQYVEGSGLDRQLKPGESITVPLALPVDKKGESNFRILPREWRADNFAEVSVLLSDDTLYADHRRARVIEAVSGQPDPFWRHIAERYADAGVIEAMLSSVMEDDAIIVARAASVLARQGKLPEGAGADFAALVRRWLPQSPRPEWGGLREDIVAAALKTQSEEARTAVLDAMRAAPDATSRWIAINALRLSPGDGEWFRRARAAIIRLQRASPSDIELARQSNLAVEWLDGRLEYPEPPQRWQSY